MTEETAKIKLYQKTYQLPRLDRPDVLILQDQIQSRQQLIKSGKRLRTGWMGLAWGEEKLSFEETFQELDRLVTDYDALIGFLTQHKEEYQRFFLSLTEEVQAVVKEKCHNLTETERERQSIENSLQSEDLKTTLKRQKQQIIRTVVLLGRASLLMLKKIEIISEGISKLTEDQETQRQVLGNMMGKLTEYKRVYQLQIKLDRLEKEAIYMAKVAVNLEQYLKPILGQFQGLINQVVQIDGQLSRSVTEVEFLVQDILRSESRILPNAKNEGLSGSLLNFLVTSEEKRARLGTVLEQVEKEGWQWSGIDFPDEEIELETAINRINAHVNGQVSEFREPFKNVPIPLSVGRNEQTVTFETVIVNNQGKIIQRQNKQASDFGENLGENISLDMIAIPGGQFQMGAEKWEKGASEDEYPQHPVTIPPFYMSKYPITQAQWQAIAALPTIDGEIQSDPAYFKGDNRPVEQVSWYDAIEFCKRLSELTGRDYRLPSEAQWEYACRAATITPFNFGQTLTSDLANYDGTSTYAEESKGIQRGETTPVGQFLPNAFGLYDLHGNVWEWCADSWHPNYQGAPTDGSIWEGNDRNDNHSYCVLRGGSWYYCPNDCRCANRSLFVRGDEDCGIGFRVVCLVGTTP